MRDLHVAYVEIVVGKDRASDRADEHGVVLQAEFFDCFGNQLVGNSMAASRAIVGLVPQVGFAFVLGIEDFGLGMDYLVCVLRRIRLSRTCLLLSHGALCGFRLPDAVSTLPILRALQSSRAVLP